MFRARLCVPQFVCHFTSLCLFEHPSPSASVLRFTRLSKRNAFSSQISISVTYFFDMSTLLLLSVQMLAEMLANIHSLGLDRPVVLFASNSTKIFSSGVDLQVLFSKSSASSSRSPTGFFCAHSLRNKKQRSVLELWLRFCDKFA